MATTEQYLKQLQKDKKELIANLQNAGIVVSDDATFSDISATPLSTNILNGAILNYKADNITIPSNTFVEFVNYTNPKVFNNGYIIYMDEIDSTHLFVCYRKYANYNYYLFGAVITIGDTIEVVDQIQLVVNQNSTFMNDKCVKKGNNYLIYSDYYGELILVSINPSNYTLTKLDEINSEINPSTSVKKVRYIYSENFNDYFGVLTALSGLVQIQIVKVSNNEISLVGSQTQVFYGQSYYGISGIELYPSESKFLIVLSQNHNMYYYIYTLSNEELTLENNSSFSDRHDIITAKSGSKLYVFYMNNDKYSVITYTIDFANNTLTSNNNSVELVDSTNTFNKVSFVKDKLWIFGDLVQYTLKAFCINKTTLTPIQIKDILTFTNNVTNFYDYVACCEFNDKYIFATQLYEGGAIYDQSNVYILNTIGDIVIGYNNVKPSISKIDGLSKTECTNLTSGEVWILNN